MIKNYRMGTFDNNLSIEERIFTLEDQKSFATLSGDHNPIHTDTVAARRFIFGRQVVHGIHAILWAIDNWLEGKKKAIDIRRLKALFPLPIGVAEKVYFTLTHEDDKRIKIKLLTGPGRARAASLQLEFTHSSAEKRKYFAGKNSGIPGCREFPVAKVKSARGKLDLFCDVNLLRKLFPNLAMMVAPLQIAEILATTRLVGMECPGLHSIYSEIDLYFIHEGYKPPVLAYEVTDFDERFSLTVMKVTAPGMHGLLKAFFRPAPQKQDSFIDLKIHVDANEFSGQHALIVGGSRGLGEITSKLLSAGGAEVRITYHKGCEEARLITNEINSNGGCADYFRLDVLEPEKGLSENLGEGWFPEYLYFFASPFIFAAHKGSFSPQLFQKFCQHYVTGFQKTVQALLNRGPYLRRIYYPSSVAIDELPLNMGEYAAAKMAGEILCDFFEKANRGLSIYKPRLSRMATDQTVSITPVDNQNPVPIILDHLRFLRDIE